MLKRYCFLKEKKKGSHNKYYKYSTKLLSWIFGIRTNCNGMKNRPSYNRKGPLQSQLLGVNRFLTSVSPIEFPEWHMFVADLIRPNSFLFKAFFRKHLCRSLRAPWDMPLQLQILIWEAMALCMEITAFGRSETLQSTGRSGNVFSKRSVYSERQKQYCHVTSNIVLIKLLRYILTKRFAPKMGCINPN